MAFEQFPYSNFHDLNLDWIISEVKKAIEGFKALSAKTDDFETTLNNALEYINNYFKNLDVQEEINNKLEEMKKNGELAAIIASFLKAPNYYLSVQSMVADTAITKNSVAITAAYKTAANDGSCLYWIHTPKSYNFEIALSNNLYAYPCPMGIPTVREFGATANNDIETPLKNLINYSTITNNPCDISGQYQLTNPQYINKKYLANYNLTSDAGVVYTKNIDINTNGYDYIQSDSRITSGVQGGCCVDINYTGGSTQYVTLSAEHQVILYNKDFKVEAVTIGPNILGRGNDITFNGYTSTYYVAPMTNNGTICTSKSYKGPWTEKTLPEITEPVSNVAYDPVNRCLYVYGGGLYIYNPDTWELIHQVQLNHANRPNPLLPNSFQYTVPQGSFCYNGMWCLSTSVFLNDAYQQSETRIATFDLETGNIKQWWIIPIPYSGYEQECVIVDYYGIRTVAVGNDKSLCGRFMPFGYGDIQKGISHEEFTVYVDESKTAMGDGLSKDSPMNSLFNAIRTYGNRPGVTYWLLNNVTKGFTVGNMAQACIIKGGDSNSYGFAASCTFSRCYNIQLQNLTNTAVLNFQSCTVTGKNIIVNNVTAGNYKAAFNCTSASTVHFESLTANGCDTVLRSGSGSIVISPVDGSSNTVGLQCQYGGFGMTWGSGATIKGKRDTNSSCLVEGVLISAT
jgi:hypothetical protein